MRVTKAVTVTAVVSTTLATVVALSVGPAQATPGAQPGNSGFGRSHAVCGAVPAGYARCLSHVEDNGGKPSPQAVSPTGLSPDQVKGAYGFPTGSTAGAGQTVAIVDAYDAPNIESDLGVLSKQYGLPACASGCFTKVNQTGGSRYPRADSGWALEISLDVEWVHAIAPGAKILLVEASSNSFTNLMAAEDYAKAHAQYVSNSWGGSEFSGEATYDSHFAASGVSFFVSSGDNGAPAEYPSASPNVISVGGTTLNLDPSGAVTSETGWSGSGGGCSAYESAVSAQSQFSEYGQVGCSGARATPDVSLVADPATGVSVYDSTSYQGSTGWYTVGGTSASSPMWAAESATTGAVVNAAYVYGNNISFRDITSGNNGNPALVGLDLVTGRGSWSNGSTSGGGTSGGGTTGPVTITSASCSGTTCSFSATGTDPLQWNFGSDSAGHWPTTTSTTSTSGQTVSTSYSAAGKYPVTVTDANSTTAATTVTCTYSTHGKKTRLGCQTP
jgi:subtilase family serine protease